MWLVCLCVGLVAGQMMTTDSGVTDGGMTDDGSTDNLAGQTDAVEVPDTTVATEENTTTTSTPAPTEACYDVLGRDCFRYKDTDCVGPFETWARANCSLRCGYCPQKLPCEDDLNYCNEFGKEVCNQEQYGQYMREHCRKFCNFCKAPTEYLVSSTLPTTTPEPTTTTTAYNPASEWCRDNSTLNCWYYPDEKCVGAYEGWARVYCPYRCGYCPNFHPPCEDLDSNCAAFRNGSCTDTRYRAYMREHCRSHCNECTYPGQNLTPISPPTPIFISTTPAASTTVNIPSIGPTGGPPAVTPTLATAGPGSSTSLALPTGEDCKDAMNCSTYSSESCVGVFKTWAIKNCPRTCGYCTGTTDCRDYEECNKLPEDVCSNPTYRRIAETSCRKFCKLCTVALAPTKPVVTGTTEAMMVPTKAPVSESATGDQTDQATTEAVSMEPSQAGSEQPSSEVVSMPTKPAASVATTTSGKTHHPHPSHEAHTPKPHGHGHTQFTLFPPIPTGDACKDNPTANCSQYSQKSCEGAYKAWSIVNCPVHCGYCGVKCDKNFQMAIPSCCSDLCSCPDTKLSGTVRDASASNAPMANVSVYLRDCQCEALTTTDENGDFLIKGVCVKEGDLAKFEFPGYASFLSSNITNPNNDGNFIANGEMSPLVETTTIATSQEAK